MPKREKSEPKNTRSNHASKLMSSFNPLPPLPNNKKHGLGVNTALD